MEQKARLLEFRDIAPEVRHFVFEVDEVERFDFRPGQFVSLSDEVGGRKVTRAYSLASPPNGNRFELCLNRVKLGAFSPHLFSLRPGGTVPMKGPYGSFTLREPIRDAVFVATGTGVAPFRSMLLDGRLWGADKDYALILGVRHPDAILYREEFEALEREHPNFRFVPVVSRPDAEWRGRTGYVQDHVLEAVGGRRDIDVYVCGLKEMVNE
ncbi:MAG TPA: oxidoreductase, partial [Bryobacterales bacterium]|nr:oxidoreductase [Bryobacterales bacterium]